MIALRTNNYPSLNLLDSLFENLFEIKSTDSPKVPVYDVIENEKEFQIELLLAGVKKDDISIDVEKDTLIIKAERKEVNDIKYNRKQSYFGKYERSFQLPDDVDVDNIGASLNDGILTIIIPKSEEKKIKKSSIKIK